MQLAGLVGGSVRAPCSGQVEVAVRKIAQMLNQAQANDTLDKIPKSAPPFSSSLAHQESDA